MADSADPKPRSNFGVTPEEFVTMWNTSGSAKEAADKLGMPKAIAVARAGKYRKSGVELKRMPRGGSRRQLDVEGLNRLLAELKVTTPPPEGAGSATPTEDVDSEPNRGA